MTKTVLIAGKFQNGAGLSGYIAELGSVFLCRHLHIASAPRADHARYLASWLKCLNAHPRALFKAAALAQQAVDYLEDKAAIVDQPLAA
tara:strand:- start:195 stop:461 length:267 start_codon:yes stop_codon:yes gene_type:complete